MSRESLPPRDEWECSPTIAASDVTEKTARLAVLEQQGVELHLYAGSLTDDRVLRDFFDRIRREVGQIAGVIHSAGRGMPSAPGCFIDQEPEDFESVLEPKVQGLETLSRIFENDDLAFFVLCSSVSACVPGLAAVNACYAAANTFMDHFAQFQRSCGRAYISIEWVGWNDTGMHLRLGDRKQQVYDALRRYGLIPHNTREGVAIFEALVCGDGGAIVMPCLAGDSDLILENALQISTSAAKDTAAPPDEILALIDRLTEDEVQLYAQELLTSSELPSCTAAEIEQPAIACSESDSRLIKMLEAMTEEFSVTFNLELTEIDPAASFDCFGIDSVLAVRFAQRLERRLGLSIEPKWLITHNSIINLARQILNQTAGAAQ